MSILHAYRRWFRRVGQLWYEILDFSCNKSKEELAAVIAYGSKHKMILCMHPHGILPIHAITWTAYCDQYLSDRETKDEVFGFGAAADVVFYVPILRNILGWLSAGSATYQLLRDGLKEVIYNTSNYSLSECSNQLRHDSFIFTMCPSPRIACLLSLIIVPCRVNAIV